MVSCVMSVSNAAIAYFLISLNIGEVVEQCFGSMERV